jgi:hypothetical protein
MIAGGCGDRDAPPPGGRRAVPVAELPEAVRTAARKALPEIRFDEAWANLDRAGAIHSYEVRGRSSSGKIREVRVSLTGTILEME